MIAHIQAALRADRRTRGGFEDLQVIHGEVAVRGEHDQLVSVHVDQQHLGNGEDLGERNLICGVYMCGLND